MNPTCGNNAAATDAEGMDEMVLTNSLRRGWAYRLRLADVFHNDELTFEPSASGWRPDDASGSDALARLQT